jgi:hypothetical protein
MLVGCILLKSICSYARETEDPINTDIRHYEGYSEPLTEFMKLVL